MRNLWVRFGCFLTGYNYGILRGCSEAAFQAVKKYSAAMVIVCILWFLIGFTFAQRYLLASLPGCLTAGTIAVIIIVQIEKQIILSINPGKGLLIFRFCLALMMSILGSVIIDQILLQKDIETEKIVYISKKVKEILPLKTGELKDQIATIDTSIEKKEREKQDYIKDVTDHPTIISISTQTQTIPVPVHYTDQSGRDSIVTVLKPTTSQYKTSIPNQKFPLIIATDSIIGDMRKQKIAKQNILLNIQPALEKEMSEKVGFLDELKVMVELISSSRVALAFWLLWILFFLFIEMLVLFSKMGDKSSDYEKAVIHHMKMRMKRLDLLADGLGPNKRAYSLPTS